MKGGFITTTVNPLMVKGRADKSNIKCYQSFLSQNKTETKENHYYFPQVERFRPPHS